MSAVLLPFENDAQPDWESFQGCLRRTIEAGLTPAVNMDTGYVQLLDGDTRAKVLAIAGELAPSGFVAGAYVADRSGDRFDADGYRRETERIQSTGGTPVIFPSHGLNSLDDDAWVGAHREIARACNRFIGFELGPMFVPYGRIYSADAYRGLLDIANCIGAKHSSLSRALEWERLSLRDHHRPDFMVLTGNDLAIDMVMYGSDYLLGLSAFAPDLFARRDALWEAGDPAFYELNDVLQYLGCFSFREPVPAYKHDAAMFLKIRGWIRTAEPHPDSPRRPRSDVAVLQEIAGRLGVPG
jgi:dihydrodipicolinate synthase/N-acetylneuraminate lyase